MGKTHQLWYGEIGVFRYRCFWSRARQVTKLEDCDCRDDTEMRG
ncbi:MAG: hypothetical protein WBJ13_09435 [Sedimentibacter sp.]